MGGFGDGIVVVVRAEFGRLCTVHLDEVSTF